MQATSQDPMLPIEESRRRRDEVLFERGVALFNSRHFFEAHEAWEEIWLHTQPPEKTFLQGLIQVTAAFHHHSRENLRGFKSLLRAGLLKLEVFPAEHRGLQIERLRASARRWIAALENKEHDRRPGLPKISRIKKSGEARSSIET
jgi:predicted metal-dependent hydrolase